MIAKRTLKTSLFLLIISLLIPSVNGQVVVSPYDWFQVGAYAKYINTWAPNGLIFPNGTLRLFHSFFKPDSPTVLEWTIIDRDSSSVSLNVSFSFSCDNITFYKNLLLDVNIYTRDTIIDGESVGKTCFWAEPYANVGQQIILYEKPSDQIAGNVVNVVTFNVLGKEVKEYFVEVPRRVDPAILFVTNPRFVWHTGMADDIVLVGLRPIGPNETAQYTSPDGTVYRITRFSSTPLGEKLRFFSSSASYEVYLNETNVRLGPENDAGGMSDNGLLKYSPYIFVAAIAVSTLSFTASYRRKHKKLRR
ncbi:MAG TPA: hypothetical protein VIH48_01680 [Candidatus Bathyarchaeia archaeon]